jgi:hypothetical protein
MESEFTFLEDHLSIPPLTELDLFRKSPKDGMVVGDAPRGVCAGGGRCRNLHRRRTRQGGWHSA